MGFSNFIIGLGESDRTVRGGAETLAGIGVIPILRALNFHPPRPDPAKICPDAARYASSKKCVSYLCIRIYYGIRVVRNERECSTEGMYNGSICESSSDMRELAEITWNHPVKR